MAAHSDLMHHLTVITSSIRRFQQLSGSAPANSGPALHVNRTPITLAMPTSNQTPSSIAAQPPNVSAPIKLPLLALSASAHQPPAMRDHCREHEREWEGAGTRKGWSISKPQDADLLHHGLPILVPTATVLTQTAKGETQRLIR